MKEEINKPQLRIEFQNTFQAIEINFSSVLSRLYQSICI